MKLFEHFDRDKDDSIDEGAHSAAPYARFLLENDAERPGRFQPGACP